MWRSFQFEHSSGRSKRDRQERRRQRPGAGLWPERRDHPQRLRLRGGLLRPGRRQVRAGREDDAGREADLPAEAPELGRKRIHG